MKTKMENDNYEFNDNSVDDWIEKSNKSNKLVEEWERRIVEEATAMN